MIISYPKDYVKSVGNIFKNIYYRNLSVMQKPPRNPRFGALLTKASVYVII